MLSNFKKIQLYAFSQKKTLSILLKINIYNNLLQQLKIF